jgi:hypothetical protein
MTMAVSALESHTKLNPPAGDEKSSPALPLLNPKKFLIEFIIRS